MAARNYFDRTISRNSLGGFYTSASAADNRGAYSLPSRRFGQHYLHDTNLFRGKAFSSSSSSFSSSVQPLRSPTVTDSYSGHVRERSGSLTRSPPFAQMSSPHYQSSLDLVSSSLKCDDCRTNDGLFQCCHCDQRLCIQCCNKHYKNITVELERLHELSDRLVEKILHAKNDLERQKNEALEQCHQWRVDTINTINKAHTLIVQTIHDEYETLGKEYESFVQKGMAHIHVDQNELMRMKKSNLGSLLSTPPSTSTDSTNPLDTIRKRIDTFAKTVDETGQFSFHVRLPAFYIDDSLRVESRFGEITRSTSATWKNENKIPRSSPAPKSSQDADLSNNIQPTEIDLRSSSPAEDNEKSDNASSTKSDTSSSSSAVKRTTDNKPVVDNTQLTETEMSSSDTKTDVTIYRKNQTIEISDKIDAQGSDVESQTTTSCPVPSSPPESETNDSDSTARPSSRYALSVENNVELKQQQFYSPSVRSDRCDNAYQIVPSSSNTSLQTAPDHHSLTLAVHDPSFRKTYHSSSNGSTSFNNSRPHSQTFSRPPSPIFPNNDGEDAFRSISYVQLKREQDGSLEGIAIQIEQSQQTHGKTQRRRTCMESCGVRRRATILPPRCPSSNRERSSNDQPGLSCRPTSTPTFIN